MALDAATMALVAKELATALNDARIDKIHQPTRDEVLFAMRSRTGSFRLLLSARLGSARICLTQASYENPATPPSFCMLLRKYLTGGRLAAVRAVPGERIVFFDFACTDELGDALPLTMAAELMGRYCNLVLVRGWPGPIGEGWLGAAEQPEPDAPRSPSRVLRGGPEGAAAGGEPASRQNQAPPKIIDALKRVGFDDSAVRQLLPGLSYTLPPRPQALDFLTAPFSALRAAAQASPKPLPDALRQAAGGVGPVVLREVCFRALGDMEKPADSLTEAQWAAVERAAEDIRADFAAGGLPNMVMKPDGPPAARYGSGVPLPGHPSPAAGASCSPSPLRSASAELGPSGLASLAGSQLSAHGALPAEFSFTPLTQYQPHCVLVEYDGFSALLEGYYAEKDKIERLRQKSKQLRKTVQNLYERAVRKQAARTEELATSEKSDAVRQAGELLTANLHAFQKGDASVRLLNWTTGAEEDIRLDPRLSPSQNAQRYFKEYKRRQTAARMLVELLAAGEREIEYLATVLYEVDNAQGEAELSEIRAELKGQGYLKYYKQRDKRQKPADFMRYRSGDGFLILVGRNNAQNERLTLKTARGRDMWFHVKNAPGSHVVVMSEGREVPLATQNAAAMLAVWHSSQKNGAQVPVDYTQVRNIRKTGDLPLGMVLYDHYETAYVTADPAAIEALAQNGGEGEA